MPRLAAKNATRIRNWIEKAQFLKQRELLPDTFPGLDAPALLLNLLAPHQEILDIPIDTARKIFAQPKLQPWLQHFHEKTSFALQNPLPNESNLPPITLSYLAPADRTSHSYGIQWPQNGPIELLTAQIQQHETILFHLPILLLQLVPTDNTPHSPTVPPAFLRRLPILSATSLLTNPKFTAWASQVDETHQENTPYLSSDLAIFMWAIANDPHVLAYESIQTQLIATNQLLQDIHNLELNIRASRFNLTTTDSTPLALGALSALFCNQKSASLVNTILLTNPLLPTPFRLYTQDFGQTIRLTTSHTKTYTSPPTSIATSLTTAQERVSNHLSLLAHLYNDYEAAGNLALSC